MVYKTIVVHVDDGEACGHRVRRAASLADDCGAHLIGAYVLRRPIMPTYSQYEMASAGWAIEEQLAGAKEDADKAKTLFEQIVREFDLSNEWLCLEGIAAERLVEYSRYADVVVQGQAQSSAGGIYTGLTEQVVMGAGCPVLVIPNIDNTHGAEVPRSILVAWNGSREAARALADSLPLLASADEVQIVCADTDESAAAPEQVRAHLASHGIDAQVAYLNAGTDGTGELIGELLLGLAPGKGFDLIVMGAYGHTRLRELVLGGVTRYILKHMSVPVLMSH